MSNSNTVAPKDFSEGEPATGVDEEEGGETKKSVASIDLSGVPGPVRKMVRPMARAAMRNGSAPAADKIVEEYGVPEWSAYMLRGGMRMLPTDGTMNDPPAGGDVFIGFVKLMREARNGSK